MNGSEWTINNMKNIFMVFFGFSLCAPIVFAQTAIEVFVDQPLMTPSIPNAVVVVFDLSRETTVKKSLPRFSVDPTLATAQAKAWIASPDGKKYVEAVKAAYVGREKMMNYELQKIPAIVFDHGKYVIYGTTDVAHAIENYQQYRRRHHP